MSESMDVDAGYVSVRSIQTDVIMRETLDEVKASNTLQTQTLDIVKTIEKEVRSLSERPPPPLPRVSSLPIKDKEAHDRPCELCRTGNVELILANTRLTELTGLHDEHHAQLESLKDSSISDRAILETRLRQAQEDLEAELRKSKELDQKITSLNQLFVRAGRKEDSLSDSDIQVRFIKLRSEIQTLVRTHFTAIPVPMKERIGKMGKNSSADISDLIVRAKVAAELYDRFFHPDARLFGVNDASEVFKVAEMKLEECGMGEDDLTAWRNLIVKTTLKSSTYNKSSFLDQEAEEIWKKFKIYRMSFSNKKALDAAYESFFRICRQAYELALLFRSSKIEYEWRQCPETPPQQNLEVLGTEGALLDEPHRVSRIVFGGIYRGDRTTGKIRDNAAQILKPGVVITSV